LRPFGNRLQAALPDEKCFVQFGGPAQRGFARDGQSVGVLADDDVAFL
jgi:hypothetical protein